MLVAVNLLLVPRYGYMACAWAGFAGYATAMVLSYVVGQRKYPIAYPLKSIAVYVAIAAFFYFLMGYTNRYLSTLWALVANTALILLFVAHFVKWDLRRRN